MKRVAVFFATLSCAAFALQPRQGGATDDLAKSLPIAAVRLAPPAHPLPQVSALIASLDDARGKLETALEEGLRAEFDKEVHAARSSIQQLVRRRRSMGTQYLGSLEKSRAAPGIAYTLRVGVEPLESPSEAALTKISSIEAKQSKAERGVFAQAAKEMQSLTHAVLLELAEQLELGADAVDSVAFLEAQTQKQSPVANLRVVPPATHFPLVADLVEDMELRRAAAEQKGRSYILGMLADLIKVEASMVKDALAE